eukprot:tig00000241_g20923.t1
MENPSLTRRAFAFDALRPLVPTFVRYGEQLCEHLAGLAGAPVAAQGLLQRVAIDALGAAAFGRDFGALENREDGPLTAYKSVPPAPPRLSGPYPTVWRFVFPFVDALPLPSNFAIRRAMREVRAMLDQRIAACRAARAAREGGRAPSNLLEMLVAANERGKEALSDGELRDNLARPAPPRPAPPAPPRPSPRPQLVFMLAGHETTAVALSYALYELARHPEIQARPLSLSLSLSLSGPRAGA